jgi:hypothetical protein
MLKMKEFIGGSRRVVYGCGRESFGQPGITERSLANNYST